MNEVSPDVDELRAEVERLRRSHDATERRLRASHAVARALADATTLEDAMPRLLAGLGTALGGVLSSFWIPREDRLVTHSTWALDGVADAWANTSRSLRFRLGEGLPGRVWKARGPVWLDDIPNENDLPRKDILLAAGVRTGFGFPVTAGTDVCGVIDVFMPTHETADDHLVEVLRAIGGHLGQFIQHVRAQETMRREAEVAKQVATELQHERETLARVNDLGRTISAELDVARLAQSVVDMATSLIGAQVGAFFFSVSEQGDRYTQFAFAGPNRDGSPNAPLFTSSFLSRAPVRLEDAMADPRYRLPTNRGLPDAQPVRSYLAVPVVSRAGAALGVLLFGHEKKGRFDERAERLVVALAAQTAVAMDNARLFADQQRLIRELEKTNEELDQFAYAASHDLRAPLRGISNLASWIEEDLGQSTPKKVREHIAMLKGRASRMDKLINGLLELARVGRIRHKAERVDVTELLHETIDLLSAPEAARILIVGAMPTMTAERFALQQVFLNLISNAIQHGGRKDVIVRITCTERADEYEFAVSDNGVGIPAEHHERVWQIFQTLQARDVVESTGIGLTIVRKQVEANGGRAWIDPQGTGATVRFTWPKANKR